MYFQLQIGLPGC